MNQIICTLLEKLAKQYENDQIFKSKAIKKAINNIKKWDDQIISGEYAKKNIKGVGQGIANRIDEILETNTLEELNTLDNKEEKQINSLKGIIGIGPKKAKQFMELGIKNKDDLKEKISNNKLKVTHDIMMGLKYENDLKLKIPRSEIELIKKLLNNIFSEINNNLIFEICGSFRRGKKNCGDIDILITNRNIKTNIHKQKYLSTLIKVLKKQNFIIDDLTKEGEKKYMGICKLHDILPARRIDIRCVNFSEFYTALVYFTGSMENNIKLRNKAIKMNLKLNEYGLFNGKKKIEIKSEEDLFHILKLKYLIPKER